MANQRLYMCMQAALHVISLYQLVCICVRSLVKSSLDLRSSFHFSFLLCSSPTIGDKYVYYSEYVSDTIVNTCIFRSMGTTGREDI